MVDGCSVCYLPYVTDGKAEVQSEFWEVHRFVAKRLGMALYPTRPDMLKTCIFTTAIHNQRPSIVLSITTGAEVLKDAEYSNVKNPDLITIMILTMRFIYRLRLGNRLTTWAS